MSVSEQQRQTSHQSKGKIHQNIINSAGRRGPYGKSPIPNMDATKTCLLCYKKKGKIKIFQALKLEKKHTEADKDFVSQLCGNCFKCNFTTRLQQEHSCGL